MLKVGDKVKYIDNPIPLYRDEIYTISYIDGDFIGVDNISAGNPIPMWKSKYFKSIKDDRKRKLKKLYKNRF